MTETRGNPKNKMAKGEEDYWRGEKRRNQGTFEEDDGSVAPKRVRGISLMGDNGNDDKSDEALINCTHPLEPTVDKTAVSQQNRRKKVTLAPRLGAWGTMKFLLKIMWILCLCVPTSMASTAVIQERYLPGYYLRGQRLEESLVSPMNPRYQREDII